MEILNTFTYNDSGWVMLEAVGIIGGIILIIALVIYLITEFKEWKKHIGCVVGMICCCVLFAIGSHYDHLADINRYQVLIKDMSKFDYSKYKIVDQNGKIFTVQEIKN